MSRKLIAILICFTMLFGSSIQAFAFVPSSRDYKTNYSISIEPSGGGGYDVTFNLSKISGYNTATIFIQTAGNPNETQKTFDVVNGENTVNVKHYGGIGELKFVVRYAYGYDIAYYDSFTSKSIGYHEVTALEAAAQYFTLTTIGLYTGGVTLLSLCGLEIGVGAIIATGAGADAMFNENSLMMFAPGQYLYYETNYWQSNGKWYGQKTVKQWNSKTDYDQGESPARTAVSYTFSFPSW